MIADAEGKLFIDEKGESPDFSAQQISDRSRDEIGPLEMNADHYAFIESQAEVPRLREQISAVTSVQELRKLASEIFDSTKLALDHKGSLLAECKGRLKDFLITAVREVKQQSGLEINEPSLLQIDPDRDAERYQLTPQQIEVINSYTYARNTLENMTQDLQQEAASIPDAREREGQLPDQEE